MKEKKQHDQGACQGETTKRGVFLQPLHLAAKQLYHPKDKRIN